MMYSASICYHLAYMKDTMHETCSFQLFLFFRDIPQAFIICARVAYPWYSTEYTPKLTGVPSHILLMTTLEELVRKFKELRVDIE